MIKRPEYLDTLIRFKDKDLIKVVTGIRRCGKSTLFDLYCDYLKEQGIEENVFVQKVCEMIYRKEDMSKLLTFLQKTFQN